MIRYRCDGCGVDLASDGSNHFIVKIEAFAAAGLDATTVTSPADCPGARRV